MKPSCPNCNAQLTAAELSDGWCESCGRKIPEYILNATQIAERRPTERPPEPLQPVAPVRPSRPPKRLPRWLILPVQIAAGVFLVLASLLSLFAISGSGGNVSAGVRIGCGLAGAGLYAAALYFYNSARRHLAPTVAELLARDPRPPVLYLRSFRDDPVAARVDEAVASRMYSVVATEEEQIADVLREIGPVVAIGRPGEPLPELGAARLYVSNDEWQDTVSDLMKRARLIVFRAGRTHGFEWEVDRAAALVGPEKMVFLIPKDINYEEFSRRAGRLLGCEFPPQKSGKGRCGSIAGAVYFNALWSAYFLAPPRTTFRYRVRKPLLSVLKMMLEPVFKQLHVPWKRPPIRWGIYSLLVLFFLVLPLSICLLSILLNEREPRPDLDRGEQVAPGEKPLPPDPQRDELEQVLRKFIADLTAADADQRRTLLEALLPTNEELEAIFPQQPALCGGYPFVLQGMREDGGAALAKTLTDKGVVQSLRATDVRTEPTSSYSAFGRALAEAVPYYQVSIAFEKTSLPQNFGTFVRWKNRWLWLPELDNFRGLLKN